MNSKWKIYLLEFSCKKDDGSRELLNKIELARCATEGVARHVWVAMDNLYKPLTEKAENDNAHLYNVTLEH